jgi:hypothetical protein
MAVLGESLDAFGVETSQVEDISDQMLEKLSDVSPFVDWLGDNRDSGGCWDNVIFETSSKVLMDAAILQGGNLVIIRHEKNEGIVQKRSALPKVYREYNSRESQLPTVAFPSLMETRCGPSSGVCAVTGYSPGNSVIWLVAPSGDMMPYVKAINIIHQCQIIRYKPLLWHSMI